MPKKAKSKNNTDVFDIDLSGPDTVQGNITIKGTESPSRRLFQTNPVTKEWLTQDEAEERGHYWAD